MKFWKILSYLIHQTLPDWRDKFLSYKDLKKQLKLIYPSPSSSPRQPDFDDQNPSSKRRIKRPRCADPDSCVAPDKNPTTQERENDAVVTDKVVSDFVSLLEVEIDKFNSFVVEKEEEYVIRWKELQDRLAEARHSNEELMGVGREIVDFHGEMVLLENYSALNYTGLVKILKKYDKRSGALIRLPFIQKVLQEPFYTNDTLFKLVKECEAALDRLFFQNEPPASSSALSSSSQVATNTEEVSGSTTDIKKKLVTADKELEEIELMENMYMKLTLSALRALKDIRGGSSTVSAFSLPPMENSSFEEETLSKTPAVEQAAK